VSNNSILRVLTLNLWNANHWIEWRDEVLRWLNYLKPDMVGLQEVVRAPDECQATWLGTATGLHVAFAGEPRADGTMFGNAVLSRFLIARTERRVLTSLDMPGKQRFCSRAEGQSQSFRGDQTDTGPTHRLRLRRSSIRRRHRPARREWYAINASEAHGPAIISACSLNLPSPGLARPG
jgi:endonuclease/exonuclease/phosphatase family metal-dependent hydrolase